MKVRKVSGLGGKFLTHSTRKDKNLKAADVRKITRKLRQKRSVSLAKFLTFKD